MVDLAVMAVATVVGIMAAMVVATAVGIMAAMVVVIQNLVLLIVINLLEQKVGKIEALEILRRILNLKVEEVGEKEGFPAMAIP